MGHRRHLKSPASQSATLATLVAAAVRTEQLNLAPIGRKMAGAVSARHTIKRAWRFTRDRRVEVHQAMAGVIKELTRKRKKPLIVSLDWTDVRDFHTLMAAACIGGRAIPLVWTSYTGASLKRSQNGLEERLLRKIRALIPESVPVIILADRGFGRAEWAAVCQELKSRYVVRIKPDVTISCPRYRGVLRKYPTKKGMAHLFKGVDHRKDKRVRHNIVIRWRPDLPKKRDEPWFLMTDLDHQAERTCQLYARRMSIDLDLRSIKVTLQMDRLRCKMPELVRKEIWAHVLAYNLIRTVMAQAAASEGVAPRSISFKATLHVLEAFRPLIADRAGWRRSTSHCFGRSPCTGWPTGPTGSSPA